MTEGAEQLNEKAIRDASLDSRNSQTKCNTLLRCCHRNPQCTGVEGCQGGYNGLPCWHEIGWHQNS